MDLFAPAPRSARPVAGVPAVDPRAVTKAWLLELVADAPLEAAAALPAVEIARDGPGLAGAILEALRDDAALARLAPGGDLRPNAARVALLIGSAEPADVIGAVEGLRRAVAATLHAAARLDAATTAELVDRLAYVCTLVASAAVAGVAPGRDAAPREPSPAAAVVPPPPPPEPATPEPATLEPAPAAGGVSPAPPMPRSEPVARRRPAEAPREFTVPEPGHDAGLGEVLAVRRVEDPLEALRARQSRQAEPVSWRQAVEWRLRRHAQDNSPFALLAVEVDGVGRLLAAEEAGEVGQLLAELERGLASELRPADQLLREEQGRYWVTAPDTGPAVARLLAERLAESARSAASHRGIPLRVSIGIASCPEDGTDPDALAEQADRAAFAARAAGTTVA